MSKKLTLSLAAIATLTAVGGGAYTLMDSDKNYSEYIPDSVTALIGDYLPDNFKAVSVETIQIPQEDTTRNIEPDTNQGAQANIEKSPTPPVTVEPTITEAPTKTVKSAIETEQVKAQETPTPPIQNIEEITQKEVQQPVADTIQQASQQDTIQQGDKSAVDIAMQEIQESLNEDALPIKLTAKDPKAKVIEKKIVAVSSKISKLDRENEMLQEKFQKILRENRELAKKLQAIDKQLDSSN